MLWVCCHMNNKKKVLGTSILFLVLQDNVLKIREIQKW